jgi:hypothetical protein
MEAKMYRHQTVFGRLGSTVDACVAWQIRKVYEDIILAKSLVPAKPSKLN